MTSKVWLADGALTWSLLFWAVEGVLCCSLGSKEMSECLPVPCAVLLSHPSVPAVWQWSTSCTPHTGKTACHCPSGSVCHLTCEKIRGLRGRPVLCPSVAVWGSGPLCSHSTVSSLQACSC